jgi:hypothetical protein
MLLQRLSIAVTEVKRKCPGLDLAFAQIEAEAEPEPGLINLDKSLDRDT